MSHSIRRVPRAVAALGAFAAVVLLAVPAVPARAATGDVSVVASNLDNPRDLAFGPGGTLYVAEAGTGGSIEVPGPDGPAFLGLTGSVDAITNASGPSPQIRQVVGNLVSVASPDGSEATGPDGISLQGNGGIYVIMTGTSAFIAADAPNGPVVAAARKQLGRLLKVTPSGSWKAVADVGGANFAWTALNADQPWAPEYGPEENQFPDTNPYAVLALPGKEYVVDAGANTINLVTTNGTVDTAARRNGTLGDPVAYVENPAFSDSVPTCIDQGPDGALYVGTLAFGAGRGGAAVYRIDPNAGESFLDAGAHVWASDLTAITGCGFGPGGDFYVTQFDANGDFSGAGSVVRIPFAHPDTGRQVYGEASLFFPGGFAADGNSLYVSNWSILPGSENPSVPGGQVVRIQVG